MGNLRQSMTDEEWDALGERIDEDRKNGKPDSSLLSLVVDNLSLSKKKELRNFLSNYFEEYVLARLDAWIKWDEFKYKN